MAVIPFYRHTHTYIEQHACVCGVICAFREKCRKTHTHTYVHALRSTFATCQSPVRCTFIAATRKWSATCRICHNLWCLKGVFPFLNCCCCCSCFRTVATCNDAHVRSMATVVGACLSHAQYGWLQLNVLHVYVCMGVLLPCLPHKSWVLALLQRQQL